VGTKFECDKHHASATFSRFLIYIMDFLHSQLGKVQQHLAWVAVDPVDWKFYVQAISWTVTLFESYLLCVWSPKFENTPNSLPVGFVSTRCIQKQSPQLLLRATSAQPTSKSHKNTAKTRPSLRCFQASTSNVLTPPCCTLGFTRGLGISPAASWAGLDTVPSTR
jgi:hypothetical protein